MLIHKDTTHFDITVTSPSLIQISQATHQLLKDTTNLFLGQRFPQLAYILDLIVEAIDIERIGDSILYAGWTTEASRFMMDFMIGYDFCERGMM